MELLKKLAETNAPSGSEENVRKIISEEAGKYADDITVDTLGNLIVRKKGPGKRIMLTAHMDEPGVIATVIDDKGFVYFSPLGSVKPGALHGSKMVFLDGSIGIAASKAEKYEKQVIYILTRLKEYRFLGDSAVLPLVEVCGSIISGKAISSRAGCYILLQTLKAFKAVIMICTLYLPSSICSGQGVRALRHPGLTPAMPYQSALRPATTFREAQSCL